MFSKRDDCFKLIDLGQASFIGNDGYGAVCRGTKKFIAPELRNAISGRCSPSSDIFALGKSFLRCFDWPIHEATIFCGMDWPEPLLQLWDFVVTDLISTVPHQRPTALNGFKTVLSMWQQHRVRFKTKLRYYNDYNVGKVEGTSTATADTFQSVVATSSVVGEEDEAIEMICD
jgi:serine/threonine protein kinase